jgi:hypothetical protein
MDFADNGHRLVTEESKRGVFVHDAKPGFPDVKRSIGRMAPAVSPDGRHAAVLDGLGVLSILEISGGGTALRFRTTIPAKMFPTQKLVWTPDGRHLVTGNVNGTVYIFRIPERALKK